MYENSANDLRQNIPSRWQEPDSYAAYRANFNEHIKWSLHHIAAINSARAGDPLSLSAQLG
jgi:hypothetical protein